MNETRTAWKVGVFVVIALGLLAAILLVFSKDQSLFTPTYTLRLRAENVGGLKAQSTVFISGVRVGSVTSTELAPDGKGVSILLKIDKRYRIHRDAQFNVEQIGLLGDQFVVINPTANQGPVLQDGEEVECRPPFNLQALAVTAVGFIQRVDEATRMLKETITRVNTLLLTEQTLSNLAAGVGSFRAVAERGVTLADNLNGVIVTNAAPLHTSLTNLVRFSDDLNGLATELRAAIADNRPALANTLTNLEGASRSFGTVVRDLEAGNGLAGGLLKDEQIRTNLAATLQNLTTLSSNLAKYGLLHKPKPPKAARDPRPPYPGHSPARP